jgi:crotonobetainyl-CoA:carnitine CoA-transferase CaiB-like acyl-CoA transferase
LNVLGGVRVLDLTSFVQGALASAMLADMGADVIKIEPPGGDPVMGTHTTFGVSQMFERNGVTRNVQYESANRGKKSICLDLKTASGQSVLNRLISVSDVLLSNLKESNLVKLGITYERVSEINPEIIYVLTSMFGNQGPDADVPGFDISGVSRGGLMYSSSPNNPVYPVGALGDTMGATVTAMAAMAGIIARERHGIGQRVDASQLGGVVWLQFLSLATFLLNGEEYRSGSDVLGANPLFGLYECANGEWIALAIYQGDRYWPALCHSLDHPEWLDDERFQSQASRGEHRGALSTKLREVFESSNRNQLIRVFRESGIPFSPVNRISDLPADEQVVSNRYIEQVVHPVLGSIDVPALPFSMSLTPNGPLRPAPTPGEDLPSVLRDVCAFDDDEIAELASGGAFG